MKIIKRIKKEKSISQPHDLTFRNAILLNALEPEVAELFDFSTVKHESEMYADEKLRLLATDVLLSVEYKGMKGKKVYFLIEHISVLNKFIAFRMIKGTVAIVERELRKRDPEKQIPLVIPLVFCNAETPFTYPTSIVDLLEEDERKLGKQYMFNQFKLIDLNKISDKEIQRYGTSSANY